MILADFKIISFQNHKFKNLADFKILAFQNPEIKILADVKIKITQFPGGFRLNILIVICY